MQRLLVTLLQLPRIAISTGTTILSLLLFSLFFLFGALFFSISFFCRRVDIDISTALRPVLERQHFALFSHQGCINSYN